LAYKCPEIMSRLDQIKLAFDGTDLPFLANSQEYIHVLYRYLIRFCASEPSVFAPRVVLGDFGVKIPLGERVSGSSSLPIFNARDIYSLSIVLYIQKLYEDIACVVIPDFNNNVISMKTYAEFMPSVTVMEDAFGNTTVDVKIPEVVVSKILSCFGRKRFTVLLFRTERIKPDGSSVVHANTLIYDYQLQQLQRFDPNGFTSRIDTDDLNDKMLRAFVNAGIFAEGSAWKFVDTLDYCPRMSYQYWQFQEGQNPLERSGYCLAWSAWYLDFRLLNPDAVNMEALIQASFKRLGQQGSLTKIIRDYSDMLTEITYIVSDAIMKQKTTQQLSDDLDELIGCRKVENMMPGQTSCIRRDGGAGAGGAGAVGAESFDRMDI
jgi:hypothetical protein